MGLLFWFVYYVTIKNIFIAERVLEKLKSWNIVAFMLAMRKMFSIKYSQSGSKYARR